jgi:hypothetical protein
MKRIPIVKRIHKAKDYADRLGFKNSAVMIEGLSEQVTCFRPYEKHFRQCDAKRIISKISCIRSKVRQELSDPVNKKDFFWRRMNHMLKDMISTMILNSAMAFTSLVAAIQFDQVKLGILAAIVFAANAARGILSAALEFIRLDSKKLIIAIEDTLAKVENAAENEIVYGE